MVKVSIIVAVYNMEKYLKRCLDSLTNQTLPGIEIICVNDGSTDKSLEILKEYAGKDERITVLTQKNAKQGTARNKGLDIAKGEFITFVDADDWIELDYCELLYNAAQKYNVNIAAATTTRDYANKVKNHLKLKDEQVYNDVNSIANVLEYNFNTCNKLYRFEPIKDLRFEENVFYEDGAYTIKAFDLEKSMVTVPRARYHYYSNPTSTMKQKLDVKKENDKISTSLQLIRYADEHNIKLSTKNTLVYKDDHFWWKIKHYYKKKEFYFCGIKICTKIEDFDNHKKFVVFNTACFGDVLLCNSLVQNIKNIFPESKVIFVCDKNWYEIAKRQEGVDEVVIYDKKGKHKGLFGLLKFVREFPYKNIYASLITYKNERNYFVGKLLKSRFVILPNKKYREKSVQEQHSLLLEKLTNKPITNYPIQFNLPKNIKNPLPNEKYISLCCISKNPIKDMPIDFARALINKINNETDCKVVLVGNGKASLEFSQNLEKSCDFINLVNKTSLFELGQVLKDSDCLISVDTGTMHYGYSIGVKTVCVFFEKGTTNKWAPEKEIYTNVEVLSEKFDVATVINHIKNMRSVNE